MMNLKDWATQIVLGSKLQDKLIPPPIHHFDWDPIVKLPANPSREYKMSFFQDFYQILFDLFCLYQCRFAEQVY